MKPVKALLPICLLASQSVLADNIEERAWSVTSLLVPNIFQINPAAVATDKTIVGLLHHYRTEESTYNFVNNNNSNAVKLSSEKKDVGVGFQLPMGGAAFGLNADEYSRQVTGKIDNDNDEAFEEYWIRDFKMRFVIDLLPELRGGFAFRYQYLESDLLGSYGIDNDDRTRYRGTMSGYSLGLNYKINIVNIGVFTAPALRGKVTIEGEQKIITDPGMGGLDVAVTYSDRLSLGLSVIKWYYKHDDRDEASTSPVDQRNIFLRGVDMDQYFRKTLAIGIGAELALLPVAGVKGSIVQQEGVFLYDPTKVAGDNKDVETKVKFYEIRVGGFIRNKQFFLELNMLRSVKRDNDSVRVGRNGITTMDDYKHKDSARVIVLGAVF